MFTNRYAYLLGVQDYQDTGIPKLSTPINDITRLASVLKAYKFTVTTLPNPTESQFRAVFDKDLPALPPDAQVIVYYAGHGLPATNPDSDQPDTEQGYLLPVDAVSTGKDVPDRAIPMSFLATSLSALPFPQLLLILDCCYAGMFQQALKMYSPRSAPAIPATRLAEAVPVAVSTQPADDGPPVADRSIKGSRTSASTPVTRQEFTSFTVYKARQIYTSTASDQKARDRYAGAVALANGNSPFADKLCDALDSDQETVDNNDGIITLFELQTYMQPRLVGYKQLCCIFPFAGHEGGEFVFLQKDTPTLSDDKRINPFMGLMDYESKDARYFFGRRAVIEELLPIILKEPFVVVVGASGSGKSSLVKAGIIPNLEPEPHQVIQPGTKPLDSLAALTITKDRFLVIDQMEELITQAHALDKGTMLTDFFQAVFKLIDTGQVKGVIGTLRIEFIKPLKAAVESIRPGFWKQYLVPTFSIEDLTDIILRPAGLVKVFFQPEREVVGKIINDFRLYPNALPLLSLTLEDLFASTFRADHTIRLEDYKGIEAVLQKKEAVLKGIQTDDLPLTLDQINEFRQNLLIRFVSYQQGTYVRRRIPFKSEQEGELVFGSVYDTLTKRLRDALETNRLIETVLPPDSGKPEETQKPGYVEMAHEALIFSWDEFRSTLLALGSDRLIHRTELAQAATHYDPDEPTTWSNQQMLTLFGKFERPNWANRWPIRQVYQPGWGYFWPFKTFDRLFGSFIWLTVAERNFLETSYKASRRQRISVLAGLATIFILFWSFLFYLRDTELRQQQKDLVERAKDGIAQNLTTANMLAFNNAYEEALNQYCDVKDSLEQAEWVQRSSLDAYRTKEQSKVKATIDSTRRRQQAYNAIRKIIIRADSLSQWPLQHVSSEMAESCQRYTYFTRAADLYRQADDKLDKNERWFRRGVFKQTWDALHQQTLRGLTLTTIQLGNLQSACLDVSVGFDLVSTAGSNYKAQRNQYKTISQSITDYLAKNQLKDRQAR